MTTEAPKSPLRQLADIMSEHRSLLEMQQAYEEESSDYEQMDSELADRALRLMRSAGLDDTSNPLIANAQRFVSLFADKSARLRASYPTDKQRADDYKAGALYQSLSGRSKELIDKLMIDLMDTDTLGDVGTVVRTPKEAADALGLKESEVERAYGLLSDITEVMADTDTLEFMALSFDQPERIPRIIEDIDEADEEPETEEAGQPEPSDNRSYELSDRYVARVRKDGTGTVISLVMDAVPVAKNNAAYVLRNDDNAIEDLGSALATKRSASASGARRVLHTSTGETGTVRRINRLLAVSLDTFRDPSYLSR